MTKFYTFKLELCGSGDTVDEGWRDACEGFTLDPGIMPDEYDEHEDDDYPQGLD